MSGKAKTGKSQSSSTTMMILVTGASGFLGGHMVGALRAGIPGAQIRLLDILPWSGDLPHRVDAIIGRVDDPEVTSTVVHGADIVIHMAAKVEPDSQAVQELYRTNVEGTRNLYAAAVKTGCKLFVHMSSADVYGPPRSPDPRREDDPADPVSPYQRTKWEAEEALRAIEPAGTTLNILRPAGIYGPGSYYEIARYKRIIRQRWALEFEGAVILHPTHAQDVVEAILALLARPATHGTVFNIGGDRPIRLQDLDALVAQISGVRRRRFVVPSWFAGPLTGLAAPLLSVVGRANPLLRGIARGDLYSAAVDDRRFRQRYADVPVVKLEAGVQEHLEWARSSDLL